MRILVKPFYPEFLQNKLFEPTHAWTDRFMDPYVRLRELAQARGDEIATWDVHPLETADVVICLDLPNTRQEFDAARARASKATFVLVIIETPLGRPHAYNPKNHVGFDAITTFNWRICDERRYFHYHFSMGMAPPRANPPFAERRPLLMLGSNRTLGPMGLFGFRQKGLNGLPGVGWLFSGWSIRLRDLAAQAKGELYSARRRIARVADAEFPDLLDVYGNAWRGEPGGWIHKIVKPKPFACARGPFNGSKEELLPRYRFHIAYENAAADIGYISEKMIDSLAAGVVPIYLGDQRIAEHFDPACFVDARKFRSERELLSFVRDCSEAEWHKLRDAGRRFAESDAIKKFLPDAFAARILQIVDIARAKR